MLSLMSYEHVRRSVSLIIRLVSEFTGTVSKLYELNIGERSALFIRCFPLKTTKITVLLHKLPIIQTG